MVDGGFNLKNEGRDRERGHLNASRQENSKPRFLRGFECEHYINDINGKRGAGPMGCHAPSNEGRQMHKDRVPNSGGSRHKVRDANQRHNHLRLE